MLNYHVQRRRVGLIGSVKYPGAFGEPPPEGCNKVQWDFSSGFESRERREGVGNLLQHDGRGCMLLCSPSLMPAHVSRQKLLISSRSRHTPWQLPTWKLSGESIMGQSRLCGKLSSSELSGRPENVPGQQRWLLRGKRLSTTSRPGPNGAFGSTEAGMGRRGARETLLRARQLSVSK